MQFAADCDGDDMEIRRLVALPLHETKRETVIKTGMTTIVTVEAKRSGETQEEEDARLDLEEAELKRAQEALIPHAVTGPPKAPDNVPIIPTAPGTPDSWGVRSPCSMETMKNINSWIRLHQAQGWRRHDALADDENGTTHLIQQVILSPPLEQTTNPAFPTLRYIYFCYGLV